MSLRVIKIILILLIPFKYVTSQVIFDNYTVESWTIKDGLPTEAILNIAIDTNNFIWLNTYEGLVQFDGVNFKIYSAGKYPEIKSNNFYRPIIDKHNNVWSTTQFGKLLKIKNGKIELFTPPYSLDRIVSRYENGDCMTSTPKGEVVIFNPGTKSYNLFDRSDKFQRAALITRLNQYNPDPNRQIITDDNGLLKLFLCPKCIIRKQSLFWS